MVWDVYFQAEASPPVVTWWEESCPIMPEDTRTAVYINNKCYAGLFRDQLWQADVAWRGNFSHSAYSHELLHAWQSSRGIYDPTHSNAEWDLIPIIDKDLSIMEL